MAFRDRPANCPPEVDAVETGAVWPEDQPFPFTAEEALWILKGYAVRPRTGDLTVDVYHLIPGAGWELIDGALVSRQ